MLARGYSIASCNRKLSTVRVYRHLWAEDACDACPSPVGLGGHDARGKAALRKAVTMNIARPLAEYGIVFDPDGV